MPTAAELLASACTSGISCLNEKNLLVAIAQGASAGGGGGGGGGGTLSTDGTFAANSDLLYPSQKAAKTYIDTGLAGKQNSLGFTPENVANKSIDGTFAANSDTLYPSQKAAKTYVDNAITVTAAGLYVLKAGDTMTGALLLPNGAVGAPSLSHVADANTGLWFPAADTIAFSTAGAERVRIDSVGLVGIGTTSPQKQLHVGPPAVAAINDYQIIAQASTAGYGAGMSMQSVLNGGGALKEMARIVSDGEGAWNTTASTQDANISFWTTLDGTLAQRMVINASGLVGIGIVSPLARLHVTPSASGTDYFRIDHSDGTPRFQLGALTGSLTFGAIWFGNIVPSSTNYGLASDGATLRVNSPIAIPSGANQRAGNAVLVGGTVTVSNTTVTANTIVLLTRKVTGGTIGFAVTYTVSAATSFTITSDNVLDTSTYSYLLIEVP